MNVNPLKSIHCIVEKEKRKRKAETEWKKQNMEVHKYLYLNVLHYLLTLKIYQDIKHEKIGE